MNADDRQVIRSALEQAVDVFSNNGLAFGRKQVAALALLDKPEPESAGDALELADLVYADCVIGSPTSSFRFDRAVTIIQEFVARIRSEVLDLTDAEYEEVGKAISGDLPIVEGHRLSLSGWAAYYAHLAIRSLSTGTP